MFDSLCLIYKIPYLSWNKDTRKHIKEKLPDLTKPLYPMQSAQTLFPGSTWILDLLFFN